MLLSIDTCQSKVFAGRYHIAILLVHAKSSSRLHVFFKVNRSPSASFAIGSRVHVGLILIVNSCSEAS